MRRRALLATVAGAMPAAGAGCVIDRSSTGDDGDGSDPVRCGDVEIASARASVDFRCDYGPSTDAEATGSAPGCDEPLTVELVEGDDVVERRTVEPSTDWSARFEFDAEVDPGEALFRVRDPDDVVAERTVDVEHYRDAPRLSAWDPTLEAASVEPGPPPTATVEVGETVTARVTVGNVGGSGAFTARLLADGEPIASREGTVDGATDCDRPSGPELSLSHAFEAPGEYDLSGELEVGDGASDPATWDAGSAVVEASD